MLTLTVSQIFRFAGMVDQAVEELGGLDIVVNNAGILRDVIFHKMTEDDWDSVIAVHLKGSFNVSRAAASVFRERESGAFIHMTSTSGLVGNFGQANYAAAKLGIAGLSKSIALDMGRFNVRSNCISPFAWSRMIGTIPIGDDAQRARVEKLKTMTTAKIAPVAVALCAPESKVTGQIFGVRNNEIFLMGQSVLYVLCIEGKVGRPRLFWSTPFRQWRLVFIRWIVLKMFSAGTLSNTSFYKHLETVHVF